MEVGYFGVGIGPTVSAELVRTIATAAERLVSLLFGRQSTSCC
jgi:hypothetical protein